MSIKFIAIMGLGLIFLGCGPGTKFNQAQKLEKKGKPYRAWETYQEFVARYPTHEKAPEALFRAGWLAQKYLNDCFAANTFFERVMEQYPQSDPWAKAASMQKLNCPDYFPLIPGSRWVEGDRESSGQIARTEITCNALGRSHRALPSESGTLVFAYFAGGKQFKTNSKVYRKTEGELLEYSSEDDPRFKTILKWPLSADQKWTTRADEKSFHYEVKEAGITVKVVAGEFKNCVKIGSFAEGSGGVVTNEYYAPNVGRILKTISTSSGETRVTELLSYDVKEFSGIAGESNASTQKEKGKEK